MIKPFIWKYTTQFKAGIEEQIFRCVVSLGTSMQQIRHSCMEMSECDWGMYSALGVGTQLLDASAGKSREVAGLCYGS